MTFLQDSLLQFSLSRTSKVSSSLTDKDQTSVSRGLLLPSVTVEFTPANAPFDGRWWSPTDLNNVIGGRLELDQGIWRVFLSGWIGPWESSSEVHEIPELIHGNVGTTPVTLLNLVPGGYSGGIGTAPHESRISANIVLVGIHATSETKYTKAWMRPLHLNEWANRRPWQESFKRVDDKGSSDGVTVAMPDILTAEIKGAKVFLGRSLQRETDLSHFKFSSDEWIGFEFSDPFDIETIEREFSRPLRYFLELASNVSCPQLGFELTAEGAAVTDLPATVLSSLHRGHTSATRHSFQLLFNLSDTNFETVIPMWWQLQEEIGVVTDLWASLRRRSFVGNDFMNAATAVESYHRHRHPTQVTDSHKSRIKTILEAVPEDDREWLKGFLNNSHEPSFSNRMDDVVSEAGDFFTAAIGSPKSWRNWVRDGRVGTAHRGPNMINVDSEWTETIVLTATVQWLLTIVFLEAIGIADTVYEQRIQQWGDLNWYSTRLHELKPAWFPEVGATAPGS